MAVACYGAALVAATMDASLQSVVGDFHRWVNHAAHAPNGHVHLGHLVVEAVDLGIAGSKTGQLGRGGWVGGVVAPDDAQARWDDRGVANGDHLDGPAPAPGGAERDGV